MTITANQTAGVLRYTAGLYKEAAEAVRTGDLQRAAELIEHFRQELTDHIVRLQQELDGRE